jgi:hypothetical protein
VDIQVERVERDDVASRHGTLALLGRGRGIDLSQAARLDRVRGRLS